MYSLYQTFVDYLKESYQELKRVIWPSREATIRLTIIVIAISLVVSVILGVFDALFNYLLRTFILP